MHAQTGYMLTKDRRYHIYHGHSLCHDSGVRVMGLYRQRSDDKRSSGAYGTCTLS